MNLIEELPFLCVDGKGNKKRIGFAEITDPTWQDIWAPRPDFRGASFQFLIGLLQLVAPDDLDEWWEWWDSPPDAQILAEKIAPYQWAFDFNGERASFMQETGLPDADPKGIAGLLIESPGEKTIKDNLDHFIKRDQINGVSPHWAALALFTMQINAPSGGVGHRVSLRGGGPLTTLLLPAGAQSSLWHKLWLNVLPREEYGNEAIKQLSDVLPWTGVVRTSEAKTGKTTTPDDVHLLQAYWSMPRRVLFDHTDIAEGVCDLSGEHSERLLRTYRTVNYGVNYTGTWMHPLTPYTLDPKNDPLSIKGQRGGIGYRHWLGLTLGNEESKPAAAQTIGHFQRHLRKKIPARLWCFGYDMDNMKARCWYENTLPIHGVPEQQTFFVAIVANMLSCSTDGASLLNKYVREAQYSRPGDAVSNPAVAQSFWQQTETGFYALLGKLEKLDLANVAAVSVIYAEWLNFLRSQTLSLFDMWVQSLPIEYGDMQRIVRARSELTKWLHASKPFKALWKIVKENSQEEKV